MQQQREPTASESYFWPSVWAIGLHVLVFGMLFVSFALTPELPPAKPIVQATLYQLKSKSRAVTQTNQKIAGEAQKSAARQTEVEQMEQKKVEQEAVKAAEQKKEEAAQKAEEAKKADESKKSEEAKKANEAKKADEAKKTAEAKKAEEKQLADIAKKKSEEEAKKAAEEEAKKAAAEEAKKKIVEDAKKKAADDAKKKADAEEAKKKVADEAKKKAAADAAKKKSQDAARKSVEDKKAQALADLLSDKPERQQALADEQGDEVAGNFDDLIRSRASEGWAQPPSARKGMKVILQINMLPDGTISGVSVAHSSGDVPFDSSAVAAVKNIGRLTEMQGLKASDFAPYRSFKMTFTPEDLAL
jgi:colicin import membrane protein